MSFRVRPATGEDFAAIYGMAKLTGGGFTNLPPERGTLVAKLARSEQSFAREGETQAGDLYMFVLENPETAQIRGTCQVFGQVGVDQPLYSYHLSTLTDPAKAVIGQPHPTGRAALRMLEEEGFAYDRYIDIFDGGPTVTSATDRIRTVRESTTETVGEIADGGRTKMLVGAGRLKQFR